MFMNPFKARRLKDLRKKRDVAEKALRAAVWRRDTRSQKAAQDRLNEATHALMRAELK